MPLFLKAHFAKRTFAAVIIVVLPLVIFVSYVDFQSSSLKIENFESIPGKRSATYLINTTKCKIPDLDPLNDDVVHFFKREKYEPCSDKPLLTYIEKTYGAVKLKVNQSVIASYSAFNVGCCYSYILRAQAEGDFETVSYTKCINFENEVIIIHPYVRVTCRTIFGAVYKNVHVTIMADDFLKIPLQNDSTKINVFMLGIDSISNLNLQRSMPKVHSYLEKDFVRLKGYNKIADNTFPNLMALLTGRSMKTLEPSCSTNGTFDNCDLMWKRFGEHGYATVYGEDEPYLSTFNYFKKGFVKPPTTVYLRPYFVSAYHALPVAYKHSMGVCTGPENTAERMLNNAKEFFVTFRNNPTFAFYWLNSFSHDNVNFPTTMDDKLIEFLSDPIITRAMNDSVFIVFSDHGFRFGDIRFTYSGWLEERLPFFYIRFPDFFKHSHQDFVKNLEFNANNRLTTPYDVHMTLQHLLKLSVDSYNIKPSLGCPKCDKSLFEIIREDRSCKDAEIPPHYCTCQGYTRVSTKSNEAIEVGQFIVDELNKLIVTFVEEGGKCSTYELISVEAIGVAESNAGADSKFFSTYLVMIKTYPYAMFEATVGRKDSDEFELLGQISRLNRYAAYSTCVHNEILKKYCFCNGFITRFLSQICSLWC